MAKLKISHPVAAFSTDPKLTSDDDLNQALQEIGYLEAVEAQRKAELQAEISKLTEESQRKCVVVVNKVKDPTPIAEHVQSLKQACETYCTKRRGQLLEGEKKSREFTHGTIGWKDTPAKIDFLDGITAGGVTKVLKASHNVMKRLRQLLDTIFFVKTRPLTLVAEPDIKFSKTNAKKAYEAGKLDDEHLGFLGLKYVEAEEHFFIKPNDVTLKSEAA